jgi:hypothetical protein
MSARLHRDDRPRSRGVITVDDRAGLQEAACHCYRLVRDEFDNLNKLA